MAEVYLVNVELRVQGIVEVDASSVEDYDAACEAVKRGFRARLGDLEVIPTNGIVDYHFVKKMETNIL